MVRVSRLEGRIRIAGLCTAITLWTVFLYQMATCSVLDRAGSLKGRDFFQFYAMGSLLANGQPAVLQDGPRIDAWLRHHLPEAPESRIVPVYPPWVAALFVPLATLSYGRALAVWCLVSAALYGACCRALVMRSPVLRAHGPTAALLLAGSPALVCMFHYGQATALTLACVTAGYVWLSSDRRFLAGMALGTLFFKPQLGIVFAAALLAGRHWQVVTGAVLAALCQVVVSVGVAGLPVTAAHLKNLASVALDPAAVQQRMFLLQSYRALFQLAWPGTVLASVAYVGCAVTATVVACRIWRSAAALEIRYPALLVGTVLAAPHFYVYDLALLTPALLLIAQWARKRGPSGAPGLTFGLALVYVAPVLGVATALNLRLASTPLVLTWLLWTIWRWSHEALPAGPAHEVAA